VAFRSIIPAAGKHAWFARGRDETLHGVGLALTATPEQGAASALNGFAFSFRLLAGAGILLLISPLINRLMHGVH
jgi:hypothetical protein